MKIIRKISIFTFLLLGLMAVRVIVSETAGTGAFPRKKGRAISEVEDRVKFTFNEVLEKSLTGLNPEPQQLEQMESFAKTYIRFRKGQMSKVEKENFVTACSNRSEANPYCRYTGEDWKGRMAKFLQSDSAALLDESNFESEEKAQEDIDLTGTEKEKAKETIKISDVKKWLLEGNLESLESISKSQLHRALKGVGDWAQLKKTSDLLLEDSSCRSPALVTALGMKAEEFFPEEEMQKTAVSLYYKVDQCSEPKDSDPVVLTAQYRLGLVYLLRKDCEAAVPILVKVSENPDERFQSRAIYWRAHCAKQVGDELEYKLLANQLVRANPLGYHTLVLHKGGPPEILNWLNSPDPEVTFRSDKKTQFNADIQRVEILQRLNSPEYAREILNVLINNREGTELSFQLYLAILAGRNNDQISKFKVLSDVFIRDPTTLTKNTLRTFLPLKQFNTLWAHRDQINPYLLLGLIRQESGFIDWARSPVGALGLMQLMPATARKMQPGIKKRDLLNAQVNVRLGVRYFRMLLAEFNGEVELALAGYNAGPMKVVDWMRRYPTDNRMLFVDLIPFTETRNYVALIGRNYYWYLALYAPELLQPGRVGLRSPAKVHEKPIVFNGIDHHLSE